MSQIKKIFSIILKIVTLFIFFLLALLVFLYFRTGYSEAIIKDHPYVGLRFVAGDRPLYLEGCNNEHACGYTQRLREIDRTFRCGREKSMGTSSFNTVSKPSRRSKFEIVEIISIEPKGFNKIGGGGVVLAVLQDDVGLLSTTLFSLTPESEPYAFQNGEVCSIKNLR